MSIKFKDEKEKRKISSKKISANNYKPINDKKSDVPQKKDNTINNTINTINNGINNNNSNSLNDFMKEVNNGNSTEQEYNEESDIIYLNEKDANFLIYCLENEVEFNETENLLKIQQIVQNIAFFTEKFNKSVQEASPMIQQIDEHYFDSIETLKKTNEELRQAAIYKGQRKKGTYALYGAIAGTIVPGIGNLIGLSVGYLIGKLQERGIKNIEPEKYSKNKK